VTQPTTQTDPSTPTQTEPTVSTIPTEPHPEAADISVHEIMPDNKKLCMGHENDWVELYNREEDAVVLDGYYLTDDPAKPEALSLAGMTIPADGYLVITLDDSAPFRLAKDGEAIYLTFDGQVISEGATLFTAPKHFLFRDPHLRCEINGDEITVYADAYAKYVEIDSPDSDFVLSDNYFDMNAGKKTVKVLRGTPKTIRVRSVYDIR
jgi:hypothetical protein